MERLQDHFDGAGPELPPALVADLRRLEPAAPTVPDALDRLIVERGFRAAVARRRWRRVAAWGTWGAAAAAAAVLAVNLAGPRGTGQAPVAQRQLVDDYNADGRVDILDAFGLARVLASKQSPGVAWDLNRDGQVDQSDVDMLAAHAVKVDSPSSPLAFGGTLQ